LTQILILVRFKAIPPGTSHGLDAGQGDLQCKKPSFFVYNVFHVAELMKQLAGRRRSDGIVFKLEKMMPCSWVGVEVEHWIVPLTSRIC